MELLLNIFWLLIALGGVVVWRVRWTQQPRPRRHDPWREWTAFACALVLLFFVVSLTDDLHAELMVIENSCTSRRHVICRSAAHDLQHFDHFPMDSGLAVIPAPALRTTFAFERHLVSASHSAYSLPEQQIHSGRAPPLAI